MKTANKHKTASKDIPTQFDELVRILPPRALHDEAEYDNAIEFIGTILARPKRTRGQLDFVETWSILIEEYEDRNHAIDVSRLSGLDSLKHLMEQHGMNASALGRILGNVSLGGKLLRGERELSKSHIRTLAAHFHVDPSLFF